MTHLRGTRSLSTRATTSQLGLWVYHQQWWDDRLSYILWRIRRVARTKPTILQLFRTVFVLRLDFISGTVHTSTVVIFCDHNPRWYFVSPWVKVISPLGHFTVSGSISVFYQTKEELHLSSKYFNQNQSNVISMSKQRRSKNIKSVCMFFRIPTIKCYNRLFITLLNTVVYYFLFNLNFPLKTYTNVYEIK